MWPMTDRLTTAGQGETAFPDTPIQSLTISGHMPNSCLALICSSEVSRPRSFLLLAWIRLSQEHGGGGT